MSDVRRRAAREFWNATGAGTNAGVTVSQSPASGRAITVTYLSASGDTGALVTLETPAGTPIWRKRFGSAFSVSEVFPPGEYMAAKDAVVQIVISASTSNCEANIAGYEVNG